MVVAIVARGVPEARTIIDFTSILLFCASVNVCVVLPAPSSLVIVRSCPHLFRTSGLSFCSVRTRWYVLPAFAYVVYLCGSEVTDTSGASFASPMFASSTKSHSRIESEYPAPVFWTVNLAGPWIVPCIWSPIATTSLLSAERTIVSPSAMSVDDMRTPAASIAYSHCTSTTLAIKSARTTPAFSVPATCLVASSLCCERYGI